MGLVVRGRAGEMQIIAGSDGVEGRTVAREEGLRCSSGLAVCFRLVAGWEGGGTFGHMYGVGICRRISSRGRRLESHDERSVDMLRNRQSIVKSTWLRLDSFLV